MVLSSASLHNKGFDSNLGRVWDGRGGKGKHRASDCCRAEASVLCRHKLCKY